MYKIFGRLIFGLSERSIDLAWLIDLGALEVIVSYIYVSYTSGAPHRIMAFKSTVRTFSIPAQFS